MNNERDHDEYYQLPELPDDLTLGEQDVLAAFNSDLTLNLTTAQIARRCGIAPLPSDLRHANDYKTTGEEKLLRSAVRRAENNVGRLCLKLQGRLLVTATGELMDRADKWRLMSVGDVTDAKEELRACRLANAVARVLGGGNKYSSSDEDDVKRSGASSSYGDVTLRGPAVEKVARLLGIIKS